MARRIVFDEPEVYRPFSICSDLLAVDVASGRRRRLTRGVRARDPDVSRDGRGSSSCASRAERSELAEIGLDGPGAARAHGVGAGHANGATHA